MKTSGAMVRVSVLLWLSSIIAYANGAVFYTRSQDNDYPRMGKRAFFTQGNKGSSYPRIGRSSPSGTGKAAITGYDDHFRLPLKRGLFTDGASNFPRVGRRAELDTSDLSSSVAEALVTSLENPDAMTSEELTRSSGLPLGLLFFSFDKNGDKLLTRDEFVSGMITAREDGTACG